MPDRRIGRARGRCRGHTRDPIRDPIRGGFRGDVRGRLLGSSAIETLLALPILLFVGLGALQLGLVYRAQHALTYALTEAARSGTLAHADPASIREGLARGLLPWLLGADSPTEHLANLARAHAHVAEGQASGWLRLRQLSPTADSFHDWAAPALDAAGEPIPSLLEIPNDNLVHRATRTPPASGIGGRRGAEPIGSVSGQTLADANLLRLHLEYGVPLSVPVAGRLIAATLRAWNGCEPGRASRYGALVLPAVGPLARAEPRACAFYGVPGGGRPRLPVSVSATLRMQSPARHWGAALAWDLLSWGGTGHAGGGILPSGGGPTPGRGGGSDAAGWPPVAAAGGSRSEDRTDHRTDGRAEDRTDGRAEDRTGDRTADRTTDVGSPGPAVTGGPSDPALCHASGR